MQTVPGSIKLYKVDNHYENVMGSMKSSEQIHNEMKRKLTFCGFLKLKFADFLSMSKSSFTVIYRNKIFTINFNTQ